MTTDQNEPTTRPTTTDEAADLVSAWSETAVHHPLKLAPEPAGLVEPWIPENTFAARLALVRNRMGWNVKAAADACGLSSVSWRVWEGGARPRRFDVVCDQIVAATGCDPVWLMMGIVPAPPVAYEPPPPGVAERRHVERRRHRLRTRRAG